MYCTKCGALIDENSGKCKECGEFCGDIMIHRQKKLQRFIEDENKKEKELLKQPFSL